MKSRKPLTGYIVVKPTENNMNAEKLKLLGRMRDLLSDLSYELSLFGLWGKIVSKNLRGRSGLELVFEDKHYGKQILLIEAINNDEGKAELAFEIVKPGK